MQWYVRRGVLMVLAVSALMLMVPMSMRFAMRNFMYSSVSDVPRTDVAVILGAAVRRGKPSPILEERTNKAIELYLNGKVSKILMTGDNSALTHDEVTPVRKYLIDAGIPAGDIFLDHAGFDTYSSMYRARDIFEAQSMTVVTQDFHLPRAVYIARHLGVTAYGVHALGQGTLRNYVREIPASLKALFDIVRQRVPKYLGEKIPLTGDGSTTWY